MKGKKILIISIIIILILALCVGGIALAYMKTDFLKSEQELFYKYMLSAGEKLSSMQSAELEAYLERTKNNPYENKSKLSVNVDIPEGMAPGLTQDYWQIVNNLNITFNGKVDNSNKRVEQDISINYSDNVSFPLQYKRNEELYAITSNLVLRTFLGVKNENLQKLYENVGGSQMVSVPDKIDTSMLDITKEDILNEVKKAKQILEENITEANFVKIDDNSFALVLNEQEANTIITKELEQFQNSNILPKSIRSNIAEILTQARNLKNPSAEFLKIVVTKDNKISVILQGTSIMNIQINDGEVVIASKTTDNNPEDVSIIIKKIQVANGVTYRVEYIVAEDNNNSKITVDAQFTDMTAQEVKENYLVALELTQGTNAVSYEYNFETTKNFAEIVRIEPIKESDVFLMNNANKEYLETLIPAIVSTFSEINKTQMQTIGLTEDKNPLIYATPIGYLMITLSNSISQNLENSNNQINQENEITNQIENNINSQINNIQNSNNV
ncbi:MAG: hypothetical protein HFJ50_06965 [Clostridia bacterium]|jgi:hypothetical protein|nr:hypothetical protein [Clostridia bacterium]